MTDIPDYPDFRKTELCSPSDLLAAGKTEEEAKEVLRLHRVFEARASYQGMTAVAWATVTRELLDDASTSGQKESVMKMVDMELTRKIDKLVEAGVPNDKN